MPVLNLDLDTYFKSLTHCKTTATAAAAGAKPGGEDGDEEEGEGGEGGEEPPVKVDVAALR